LFENITEQYKEIYNREATAGQEQRKELIFQAAVAFEEFLQRYGYYYLNISKPEINYTNSKLSEWAEKYNCACLCNPYALALSHATKWKP